MSLVGWWKLDGNAYDSSTERKSGTVSGATVNTAGIIGSTYEFDASTERIAVSGDTLDAKIINQFTISFWMMYENTVAYYWVLSKQDSATDYNTGIFIGTKNSPEEIIFRVGNGTDYTDISSGAVSSDEWFHITCTYNDGDADIYLNGTWVATDSIVGTSVIDWTSVDDFVIGNHHTSDFGIGLTGGAFLNDVRVYNHVLSLKEIQEIAKCKVLHYEFAKERTTVGDKILDSSDYGFHGTIYAADAPVWSDTNVVRGPASYEWTTSTDHSIQSDRQIYAWAQGNTTSCWVKGDYSVSVANVYMCGLYRHCFIGPQSTPQDRCGLITHGAVTYDYHNWGVQGMWDDEWHHYVVTSNATTCSCYKDGSILSPTTKTHSNGPATGLRYFILADAWGSGGNYIGSVSDARYYQTELSATDVLELYQTGAQLDSKGNLWA